jgi:exonuclease SbcC
VRPLSLAIEGFTAFRDRQDIDFESLDLFVITGPTGAGKTSILDAMVFALYGQVPRLGGKWGTSDLVSLGRVQARVHFEFSVNGKGRYRVARRLKRGASQEATLERNDDGVWVPVCERSGVRECDRALTDLLGLDFDAFCKAVVLPQGEFHRFLKGDPNERRRVLVALLGVSYFQRMAEIARRRGNDLSAGVARTDEILAEQYADATAERVGELRTTAGEFERRASALVAAVETCARHSREAGELDRQVRALGGHADELANITTGLAELLNACKEVEASRATAAAELETAAGALTAGRQTALDADNAVSALEAEIGTLDQIAGAAAAAETLRVAEGKEQIAQSEVAAADQEESSGREALEAAETKKRQADAAVEAAVTAERQAQTAFEHDREAERKLAAQVEEVRSQEAALTTSSEHVAAAAATAEGAKTEADRLLRAAEAAAAHLDRHRRQNAVAELAHGLGAGDPCPVCGVALATAVEITEDAATALEAARAADISARAAAETAGRAAERAATQLESAQTHESDCQTRLAKALGSHDDLAALEALSDSAAAHLSQAETALTTATSDRKRLESEQRRAHEEVLNLRGEVRRLETVSTAARRALEGIRSERTEAAETLVARFGSPVPSDAAERLEGQRESLRDAIEAARKARKGLDDATSCHDEARSTVEQHERQLADLDVELARFRTQSEAVARTADTLFGDIPTADVSRQVTVAGLIEWVSEASRALAEARASAITARDGATAAMLAIAAENAIAIDGADQALEQLQAAERTATSAATRGQSAVEEAERRAGERSAMEARVKEEREQIAVLGALAHELRSDRFGEYIVEETLALLAVQASEELLRISDGRYSLVPVEGDFHVVDHANADERRSVKTLSGGETFLASLALALALSRHVGDLASEGLGAKLEAVFIDEGFGTLDPATLEEVIDALERLRAKDLVVGVISHVPELAQRVRSGLEVHKEEGRSRIVAVGED